MAVRLKANPIAVDYQRDRHNEVERRRREVVKADEPSGAFDVLVAVASTALFLAAAYVAAEAPWEGPSADRARPPAAARSDSMAMTTARLPQPADGADLQARAAGPSKVRR